MSLLNYLKRAKEVTFDNKNTTLTAKNVQDAIYELSKSFISLTSFSVLSNVTVTKTINLCQSPKLNMFIVGVSFAPNNEHISAICAGTDGDIVKIYNKDGSYIELEIYNDKSNIEVTNHSPQNIGINLLHL